MPWGTIKIISLLGDRGSGHVRVAVIQGSPLMRSGRDHVKKLGLRRLGLAPVARGRSMGMHRDIGRRQGALRIPRRLCDRKSQGPSLLGDSFAWSFLQHNY